MGIISVIKNTLQTGFNALSLKFVRYISSPKKPLFPLADRLLADAFRLGQLPSPTEQEQIRVSFIIERLQAFNSNGCSEIPYKVDQAGNVIAQLHSQSDTDIESRPLLVFSRLVSERWNSLESLGKLEIQHAQGAGLADALGPAALLSIAESYSQGEFNPAANIVLFFSALHFDDPLSDVFLGFTSHPKNLPALAIGVQGFKLGQINGNTLGSYRAELTLREKDKSEEDAESSAANSTCNGQPASGKAVSALIEIASRLNKMAQTFDPDLIFFIRHIEAQSAFSRSPSEGVLEFELESSKAEALESALEKIKRVFEPSTFPGVKTAFRIVSYIPPGDHKVNKQLTLNILNILKELKIKVEEEDLPDPASFFSAMGIPALSVGIASGRQGMTRDTIEIASIEKGRQMLEMLLRKAGE